MARPRKPDELKILDGTHQRSRDGDTTTVVADGEAKCPEYLTGEARKFWEMVVPGLIDRGIAKEVDTSLLATMCEWWGRYRKYSKALDKVKASKDSYMLMVQTSMAQNNFDKIASRFGFTPSDRAKLRVNLGDTGSKPKVATRKRSG